MKNWKTTLVGIALIGGGIYTGVTGVASWTEVLAVIATGMGFILSKDYNVSGVQGIVGTRPKGR